PSRKFIVTPHRLIPVLENVRGAGIHPPLPVPDDVVAVFGHGRPAKFIRDDDVGPCRGPVCDNITAELLSHFLVLSKVPLDLTRFDQPGPFPINGHHTASFMIPSRTVRPTRGSAVAHGPAASASCGRSPAGPRG